jgi:hypothetical protein
VKAGFFLDVATNLFSLGFGYKPNPAPNRTGHMKAFLFDIRFYNYAKTSA